MKNSTKRKVVDFLSVIILIWSVAVGLVMVMGITAVNPLIDNCESASFPEITFFAIYIPVFIILPFVIWFRVKFAALMLFLALLTPLPSYLYGVKYNKILKAKGLRCVSGEIRTATGGQP